MSPEQASGKEAARRADIWSFGVVLFEMLTGRQAFDGETVAHVLAAVLAKEPGWDTLPQNLHPRLRLLFERCLAKSVKSRYAGIADARVDIETVLADPKGVIVQPATAEQGATSKPKLPWIAAAVFAAAAVALGVAAWRTPTPSDRPLVRLHVDLGEDVALQLNDSVPIALSPDGTRLAYAPLHRDSEDPERQPDQPRGGALAR